MDALRGEEVFLDLVGDDAEAGLFDGESGQRFGLRRDRRGHGVDDGIDLCLRELGEDGLRLFRAARKRAGLGDGRQVLVGLRWRCRASQVKTLRPRLRTLQDL